MQTESKVALRIIKEEDNLLQALKIMDKTGFRSLLVLNNAGLFKGILSIGDIQRAIIRNLTLDIKVREVLRSNPRIAREGDSLEEIKRTMIQFRMEFIPVIDNERKVKRAYFWDELFTNSKLPPKKQFDVPIVIMAGGLGSRLKPLTNVLPKPLVPIGNKTMIEEIFENFASHGCKNFLISVNYKSELIEFYLRNQNLPYNLTFFNENTPRGTAGSLTLMKEKIRQTFFVSNCDILIKQDYSEILDYHMTSNNDITVVAVLKHYPIPYGTIKSGESGLLKELIEKPELTLKINSGMYILEPTILSRIPDNVVFHITQLIDSVKTSNGKVGVFPVSEKSWVDIGEWEQYYKNIVK